MGRVDILSASAGSGKTYRLALNYIRTLIDEPNNYRHILAVTFTNKATDELKGRILDRLNRLAGREECDFDKALIELGYDMELVAHKATIARNLILHDYNNFAVMTIDKFFQRVMRAFIKEIGVDLSFNLELKTDSLLEEAADLMLENVADDKALYHWVANYIGDNISEGASWNIKGAIVELGKELFKEGYRSSQIDSTDKPELESIIKSFTTRANQLTATYRTEAQRFTALMDKYGLTAGDFAGGNRSSVALYIQKVASGLIVPPSPAAIKAVEQGVWHKAGRSPHNATIDAIEGELHGIVSGLIEIYPEVATADNNRNIITAHYRDFALLADLRTHLNAICSEKEILPISDVNEMISSLVSDNDAPFIYEKAGNRYDYFMIDEFQDTSTMQWSNFVPLLHNAISQSAENPVLLVGDVKQSIYRWRGGDWGLLAYGVKREFADIFEDNLDVNRRSTREVVDFNNGVTQYAVERVVAFLSAELEEARNSGFISADLATQLCSMVTTAYNKHQQLHKEDVESGYVSVISYDKNASIHPVIAQIEELQSRGYRASDIAVLVRSNREASEIATKILAHKNNPERDGRYIFDVVTQEALAINSSPAVQFIIACMSLINDPEDKVARALYNGFFMRPHQEALTADEEDFLGSLALLQPEEVFNELMLHFPNCNETGEVPYLQALHSQIINFSSSKIADTSLFVKWWNENGYKESVALPSDADAITIMTIHKSKGLGFKAVILPYCSWSLKPLPNTIFWAQPNNSLSERITRFPVAFSSAMARSVFSESYYHELTFSAIDSLNTLYVALTRAKQELHIMIPDKCNNTTVGAIVRDYAGLSEEVTTYTLGEPTQNKAKSKEVPSLAHFDTHSPSEKIAVRYSHQRYDEESSGENIDARDYGIMMHKAMEQAVTREEITQRLQANVIEGLITVEEAETVEQQIDDAFTNPMVAEWFDGNWECVMCERELIVKGRTLRPDRIMVRGEEAVVVDYKFGLMRSDSHRTQIERYAEALNDMGYNNVRGYLWYITLGSVEQVVGQTEL